MGQPARSHRIRLAGVALFMLAFARWLTVGTAFLAIKRRRIAAHKEWMIRGYVVTFAVVAVRYLLALPIFAPPGNPPRPQGTHCFLA